MSAKQLQDVYHQNCIGCHADMAKAGQDTGPLESECRTCHNPKPDMVAKRQPINMDKSLHFRHISSKKIVVSQQNDNCGACHMNVDFQSRLSLQLRLIFFPICYKNILVSTIPSKESRPTCETA